MIRQFKTVICIGILGICVLMGMRELQIFETWNGKWNYASEDGISLDMAKEVLKKAAAEEKNLNLVFWGQKNEQTVSIRDPIEKEIKTNVLLLFGNPQCLAVHYFTPQIGDKESCLIDKKTAYQLWGNENVIGMPLWYSGRKYIVGGVTENPESAIFIQMPEECEELFHRVTVTGADNIGNWNLTHILRDRYQLEITEIRWDFLRGGVKIWFVVLVMVGYIYLIHIWKVLEKRKLSRRVLLATGIFILILLGKITGLSRLISDCIPPKWSDFSFYPEIWGDWRKGISRFLELPLSAIEVGWFLNCIRLCRWIVIGGITIMTGLEVTVGKKKIRLLTGINDNIVKRKEIPQNETEI